MIIKKFTGKTKEEAMSKAQSELGDSVVLMSSKNGVKPKGFFGFLKPSLYEVTVAKEEDEDRILASENNIKETIATVDKLRAGADSNGNKPDKKDNTDSKNIDEVIGMRLDSIQNLLETNLKNNISKDSSSEKTKPGDNNSSKIKDAESVSDKTQKAAKDSKNDHNRKNMMDFMKLLYNTMLENEVNEKYANQMIEELEQNLDENTDMEYVLSHIYQKMILKFGKVECITPSETKCPKLIYFVGPTGVGKTTTLAKLASKLYIVKNKKVALFTTDTYRIAASNQLKTYAEILKAPFCVIYSKEDLLENFNKYKDYDYILVDTAGHSHHNESRRTEMNNFVHLLDDKCEKEVYLVLSATTKYRDLLNITDTYKELTDYKLIFTKLDETDTYGNLLNIKMHTGASLSYVTYGQDVPDDISEFDPQKTVKDLLSNSSN